MSSHVVIRGYASIFDQRFRPDGPTAMIVRPGAFQLDASIPFCVDHRDHDVLATSADDVRLWQDAHGLAFEISVADNTLDKLARDVANRRRDAVSVGFAHARTSNFETRNGEPVEIVNRTSIDEISLLAVGACPGARAWIAIGGQDRVPSDLQNLATRVGRQQQIVAAQRKPAASGRRRGHVPASVVALVRSPAFAAGARVSAEARKVLFK
jgi:HK97 family phage prohead protease